MGGGGGAGNIFLYMLIPVSITALIIIIPITDKIPYLIIFLVVIATAVKEVIITLFEYSLKCCYNSIGMTKIRTRFAPSPTGLMHIGSLRTALYAYALARHFKGDFILRIEDTDKKREVAGSREKIIDILKLFELNWDEYYVQSERAKENIYKKAAEKLIKNGHAFYCQCEAKNAKEKGFSKELRDPCRARKLIGGAIKLKVPDNENISFRDFVLDKEISWDTSTVADATLLKSDGFPTYHLAVVVDDTDMKITHVLRGHDWMPSTPIHLLVYKYLGFELPQTGHLTDILDPNGGKLSKRKGSTTCEGLLKEGYLPEAIQNFIMLLGWAPKDNRELFTLDEFVKAFDIKGFQKANPVFNRDKLDWFNGHYIRLLSDEKLTSMIEDNNPKFKALKRDKKAKITQLVKERLKKLNEFDELAGFFYEVRIPDRKLLGENYTKHLTAAMEALGKDIPLDQVPQKYDFKVGDFFMDLRIAVTGSKFTPPINESIAILGKEETVKRIKKVLDL